MVTINIGPQKTRLIRSKYLGVTPPSSLPPLFLRYPLLYKTCPTLFKICFYPPFFPFHYFLEHFMHRPPLPSHTPPTTSESTILYNTPTSPASSHCRYLFQVTNRSHLNSNETNPKVTILDILY